MVKKICVVMISFFMMISLAGAAEIAGVNMPDTMKAGDSNLILNGAGVRTKFFLDLYVGGLYVQQKSQDAQALIDADAPMAIRLQIISSLITSEKMEDATREGFENATKDNTAPIQNEIESFIGVFKEKINENDIYDFIYTPAKGVEMNQNGAYNTVTTGLAFKKALFGIWLCDKPAQKSLKEEMLGK